MDWFNTFIQKYNEIAHLNPLIATIALPVIGGLMFYLKNLPSKIWNMVVRSTTVTLSLNNAGFDGNIDAYRAFDSWFMKSGYKKFSRNFFMFRQYREDLFQNEHFRPYRMGIGNGTHFFFYSYRFFWFHKGSLESGGSERQKEEITIRTLGWNSQVFESLIELFNKKKTNDGTVMVHTYSSSDRSWQEAGTIIGRDINTFCMNRDQKADIIEKIKAFAEKREWYRKKGLTYKLSFLFKGPPGTGKTTLAKLLASHFERDIYIIDLSEMSNASLVNALAAIKPGSIVLLEDIDEAGSAVRDRESKKEDVSIADALMDGGRLTMSGLLNAFDGVIGLDNLIVMMTTNKPEALDEAVKRKGRVDYEYLIDHLSSSEIYEYIQQMYEVRDDYLSILVLSYLSTHRVHMPGCEIENIFKEHPDDAMGFLNELAKRNGLPAPSEHPSVKVI